MREIEKFSRNSVRLNSLWISSICSKKQKDLTLNNTYINYIQLLKANRQKNNQTDVVLTHPCEYETFSRLNLMASEMIKEPVARYVSSGEMILLNTNKDLE